MALTWRIGETTRMVGVCERLKSSVFLKKATFECKVDSSSRMSSTSPLTGILHRSPQSEEIAKAVKTIRPDIRLDVIVSGNSQISAEDLKLLKSCEVLIADPNIVVDRDLIHQLPNLRWLQSLWAGVDRLSRSVAQSGSIPNYTVTRNGAFYGLQMAEYVLGYIIDKERHLTAMKGFQQQSLWKRLPYRSLTDVTLGIVGFGDIGKQIAKVAKAFEVTIWALVKELPSQEQRYPAVDEYRLVSELPELLAASDYVLCVLPSVPSTDGMFDGEILSHCAAKKSVFINIGRGNIVHEDTIIKALDREWIGGAVLDVFQKEPLPVDSPLWKHPKVSITPHLAGLCIDNHKVAESFIANYDLYVKGEPLKFPVDWKKGY